MALKSNPNCDFTLSHYRYCLEQGLDKGYRFFTMNEYVSDDPQDEKIILLRHDEDFSLQAARRLADVEAELGIRSTFFFRLHAHNYNLLSLPSLEILSDIQGQGHEIGLHGETHAARRLSDPQGSLLRLEQNLLSHLLGKEVVGLSLHEPSRVGLEKEVRRHLSHGFKYEAYGSQFYRLKYISDSSARWREGCMCQHIGRVDYLYILTHGFWWYDETPLENY